MMRIGSLGEGAVTPDEVKAVERRAYEGTKFYKMALADLDTILNTMEMGETERAALIETIDELKYSDTRSIPESSKHEDTIASKIVELKESNEITIDDIRSLYRLVKMRSNELKIYK